MQPVCGYYGVLNVFEETFTQQNDQVTKEREEEISLWKQFKEEFTKLILFIVSKGEAGETVFLSAQEIASITQFLRWAQYSLLSGFNVPPRKISDFINNIPAFIGDATVEVFYVGNEPNDKLSIVVTAPVKFHDFCHEFLLPINHGDFENRNQQLYDDILNSKWRVYCSINGRCYENVHSVADIIKCGSFDLFMLKFINSSEVVKQLFMKYYKDLNLRGINQKLSSLENNMRDKRDLLLGVVPIGLQQEHTRIRDLKMRFHQVDSCIPTPVEENIHLYKESLLPGVLFSEETQEFYLSKKYDINTSSAIFMMEFYNQYCLNYNMEHNILPAIMNVSLEEDFDPGANFLKARLNALDVKFKEQLLSNERVRKIEDAICRKIEHELCLEKIESIEYDHELHQMRIYGTLTEKDYFQLTGHLEHGIVDVTYEREYILVQFLPNLSSMLQKSQIFSEIKDKTSSQYSELDEYLSRSVYLETDNKNNLRQQERIYDRLMSLKKDLKQLRDNGKTIFDASREKAIKMVFEDILQKVQATLFGAIATILENEG